MSDLVVPNNYSSVVQRLSVLNQLLGNSRAATEIVQKTQRLRRMWAARVTSLKEAGMISLQKLKSLKSVIGCRYTFIMRPNTIESRSCRMRSICPFCYARNVRDVWEQIDAAFFNPTQAVTDYHLVIRTHQFTRPITPASELDVDENIYLAKLLNNIGASRPALVRQVSPDGCILHTAVYPDAAAENWVFQHRQLFRMHKDVCFPQSVADSTSGVYRRVENYTRRDVVKIVARILRYPRSLMYGCPQRVSQLLNIKSAIMFRTFETYRSFRRKKNT